jgi:hypothetical protein
MRHASTWENVAESTPPVDLIARLSNPRVNSHFDSILRMEKSGAL